MNKTNPLSSRINDEQTTLISKASEEIGLSVSALTRMAVLEKSKEILKEANQ